MKNKHFIRLLKKEARKIPDEEYDTINRFYKPKFRDAAGTLYDDPGKEGDPERRIVFAEVNRHKVNHGRRIKKLFQKYGMPAVDAYFFVKGGMVQESRLPV